MVRSSRYTGIWVDRENSRADLYVRNTLTARFDNATADLTLPTNGLDTASIDLTGRGAVTQATNHSTGVTVNATSGVITLASVDLAAGAEAQFTVTNSTVAVGDVVVACVGTNNDASGTPSVSVLDVAAGSFDILLTNLHASTAAFNDATTVNFAVIGCNA